MLTNAFFFYFTEIASVDDGYCIPAKLTNQIKLLSFKMWGKQI
jgi:hypothetical protein